MMNKKEHSKYSFSFFLLLIQGHMRLGHLKLSVWHGSDENKKMQAFIVWTVVTLICNGNRTFGLSLFCRHYERNFPQPRSLSFKNCTVLDRDFVWFLGSAEATRPAWGITAPSALIITETTVALSHHISWSSSLSPWYFLIFSCSFFLMLLSLTIATSISMAIFFMYSWMFVSSWTVALTLTSPWPPSFHFIYMSRVYARRETLLNGKSSRGWSPKQKDVKTQLK